MHQFKLLSRLGRRKPAQLPLSPVTVPDSLNTVHFDFIHDVLDKRYALYEWCEEKINTLATMNSILVAALFAVSGGFIDAKYWFNLVALILCFLAVLFSLVVVLWHIIPTMRSGRLPKGSRNLRSVVGVSEFESTKHYMAAVLESTDMARFEAAANQVLGMNRNIMKNQRAIRLAVFADMAGLGFFIVFVGTYLFTR